MSTELLFLFHFSDETVQGFDILCDPSFYDLTRRKNQTHNMSTSVDSKIDDANELMVNENIEDINSNNSNLHIFKGNSGKMA